jgi:hypothetical protein
VVENVKGAQPWVGKAKANYGSFYLWGDVESVGGRIVAAHQVRFGAPAVKASRGRKPDTLAESFKEMPSAVFETNGGDESGGNPDRLLGCVHHDEGARATGDVLSGLEDGRKVPGMNFHEYEKTGKPGRSFQSAAVATLEDPGAGVKQHGSGAEWFDRGIASHGSASKSRKAASAAIAKIPLELAAHIARCFKPKNQERVA